MIVLHALSGRGRFWYGLTLLTLLLMLLWLGARAQFRPISLPAPAALPTSQFRVTRVVDARADHTMLGYLQLWTTEGRQLTANFPRPLEAEVQSFVNYQPAAAAAQSVVLRLHTLRITEETRPNAERGTAEMAGDFLLKTGELYYPLLSVGNGVETKGLDITHRHAANLAALLAALPAGQRPAAGAAGLTWEQVEQGQGYQPYRFPIQLTQRPRRGFYGTFREFQIDSPSLASRPFEVVAKPRGGAKWQDHDAFDARYLGSSTAQASGTVRGVWGVSDGEHVYILQRGSYFRLTPEGAGYTFTGFAPTDPRDLATGAIVGGAIGATIAGALATDPLDYDLNATTGIIHPLSTPDGFVPPADTAAVYLYRRTAGLVGAFQITVDGKPAGSLGPDQYLALTWRDRRREMRICLQSERGTEVCFRFMPLFGTTTYLACMVEPSTLAPVVRPVPTKEGAFQLKHLKLREKHP